MATITLLDLHQYHEIDRTLFEHLVVQLSRDPAEAFLAMAFWFWLENNHNPIYSSKLLKTTDYIVNKLVDEAMICLNSLATDNQCMPLVTNTIFTTAIIGNFTPLSMMHRDKLSTINDIRYFIDNVCARIFTDILEKLIKGNPEERPYYEPLNVPGFPHPVFGEVTILKLPLTELFIADEMWGWAMPANL